MTNSDHYKNKVFIYPRLPARFDLGLIRIGGSGMANSMIVAARAFVKSFETGYPLITPTWVNFTLGPWLRRERDKRNYRGLFKTSGVSGFKKIFHLATHKHIRLENEYEPGEGIIIIEGLINKNFPSDHPKDYFGDLIPYQKEIRNWFEQIINPTALSKIEIPANSFSVGIHVRMGDYVDWLRTDLKWYQRIILQLKSHLHEQFEFLLFSDGSPDELKLLTEINGVKRVFYGNALADIIALSKCNLIVASNSTFSAIGAFLGQVPVIFPHRHFGPVHSDEKKELVLGDSNEIPQNFLKNILQ